MEKEKSKDELKLIEGKLTNDAEQLNKYLSQYRYCIEKKKTLETRRFEILRLFDDPICSVSLAGLPRGNSSGVGCDTLSFKLDEINSQIKNQIEKAENMLLDIINIINLLPENSLERAIVENKYIDLYNWNRICQKNHISKSPAIRRWRRGIYMLLEIEEVKKILTYNSNV